MCDCNLMVWCSFTLYTSDVWCSIIGNVCLLAYVLMHCSSTALSHDDENAWLWTQPSGWITSNILCQAIYFPSIRKEKLHQAKCLKPFQRIKKTLTVWTVNLKWLTFNLVRWSMTTDFIYFSGDLHVCWHGKTACFNVSMVYLEKPEVSATGKVKGGTMGHWVVLGCLQNPILIHIFIMSEFL